MSVSPSAATPAPPSPRGGGRLPGWVRAVAALAVPVVLGVGVLVLGRVAPDERVAAGLTAGWFALVFVGVGVLVWRRRELLVPMGATYGLAVLAAGVLLGLPQLRDSEVNEDVVTAPAAESGDDGAAAVRTGTFQAQAHPGEGTATVVRLESGEHVVTLTDFSTDNGPDLRVYLVPDAAGEDVAGHVDLGALKGNRGDQQYALPAGTDPAEFGSVVIWCRAFDVGFTVATLGNP